MRYFGFYHELGFPVGEKQPAADLVRREIAYRSAAAAYLGAGERVFVVMGMLADPFDPSVQIPGGESVLTDGWWLWPHIAAHLVATRGIAPPDDFLDHMRQTNFQVSPVSPSRLAEISEGMRQQSMFPSRAEPRITDGGRLTVLLVREHSEHVLTFVGRVDFGALRVGSSLVIADAPDLRPVTLERIRHSRTDRTVAQPGETLVMTVSGEGVDTLALGATMWEVTTPVTVRLGAEDAAQRGPLWNDGRHTHRRSTSGSEPEHGDRRSRTSLESA